MTTPPADTGSDPAVDPDGAFVERCRIAGTAGGPLAGTAFAVKDNIAVAGMAFTAGHPLYAGRRADVTAPAVRRLLDAGADLIGMTTTDAGGFGATTPQTANPVLGGHVVGGSSGGSAAAVARGLCDFALGTDTGGSVRIPAACTGLWAFKPSYGRVSTEGVFPLAASMDHVGVIARDPAMLRRASTALLESPVPDAEPAGPYRLAVERDAAGLWHADVAEAVEAAATRLRDAGHTVERVEMPERAAIAEAHGVLVLAEAAPVYAGLTDAEVDRLGDAARRALRHAATFDSATIERARETAGAARARMRTVFAGCDALLSPTLPVPPPRAGERRVTLGSEEVPVVVAMTVLTCLANVTGDPVVALPWPPAGLQLVGRAGKDEALFGVAARLAADLAEPGR